MSKTKTTNKKPTKPYLQLTFEDARKPDGLHGGWRPNAGRPEGRNVIAHDAREEFAARYPVLVTWRLKPNIESLRQPHLADIIVDGICATQSDSFRITDYSIQTNHLHTMQEADGKDALGEGMNALANRTVRRLNKELGRSGKLFESRFHSRVLTTPREVKNAVRYVINNVRHHAVENHVFYHVDWIDPFSSGPWFDGWRRPVDTTESIGLLDYALPVGGLSEALAQPKPVAEPRTWLRRVGWRRWGLLDFDEIPGGMKR